MAGKDVAGEDGAKSRKAGAKPRKRQRLTQEERRAVTRARVLKASAKLLRELGPSGLRTLDVAKEAGVSQGAQFYHFPTKRDLLIATFEYVEESYLKSSIDRVQAARESKDIIGEIIADASEFYFSDYFFILLSMSVNSKNEPEVYQAASLATLRFRASIEAEWMHLLVGQGMAEGLAREILRLTLSLVRGFSVRSLINPNQAELDKLYATWRAMITAYIESVGPAGKDAG